MGDKIEQEILIAAPPERVWAVLTQGEHVGHWFGTGKPAALDLRPGGTMEIQHNDGEHGTLTARIERVEEPWLFSYRMLQTGGDEEPDEGNSTLIEFTLAPRGEATVLRVVETGFSALAMPQEARLLRHQQNSIGWVRVLTALQQYAASPAA